MSRLQNLVTNDTSQLDLSPVTVVYTGGMSTGRVPDKVPMSQKETCNNKPFSLWILCLVDPFTISKI